MDMKKLLIQVLLLCALFASAQAVMYIYVEEGVKLPLDEVTLYSGSPMEEVSKNGDLSTFMLSGYVDKDDKSKLYATPNLKLLLATSKSENLIKISGNKGLLKVSLGEDNFTDDSEEAWELTSERFYEKCTQCHPAKVVEEHTMLEWEGLYGSMKEFAKPTKEDTTYILRFLRAYAKDGIVKEVE
jgi:trimethylamine-N-oxide reductase cytochrome c-type subunit TorC